MNARSGGLSAPSGIDALALDVDIASREGVTLDYASSFRIAYLTAQSAALVRQTQFADAKATAVLAFAGLIAARVVGSFDLNMLSVAELAMLALKALILFFCLMVLTPRYPGGPLRDAQHRRERYSWVALSAPACDADDYAGFVRSAEVSQLVLSMARANHAVSRVLLRKFRFLRAAFLLACADVVFTAVYFLDVLKLGARLIGVAP